MLPLLPFHVDHVWMMLDASVVQEVMGRRTWVPIPGATGEIPGVLDWKGRAVAVLDVAALASGITPLDPAGARKRTIVVQLDGCSLAIPVDVVTEVQEVSPSSIRPLRAAGQRFATSEIDTL